ncbi:hypothetical protein P9112_002147 [Eukaryota sp. TZLM1-RC]
MCSRLPLTDVSRRNQMPAKLVSALHAAVSFTYAVHGLIHHVDFQHWPVHYDLYAALFLGISCGYFIYDFCLCVFVLRDYAVANTLHHTFAVLASLSVSLPLKGSFFAFYQLLTEFTTPFLHISLILFFSYPTPLAYEVVWLSIGFILDSLQTSSLVYMANITQKTLDNDLGNSTSMVIYYNNHGPFNRLCVEYLLVLSFGL